MINFLAFLTLAAEYVGAVPCNGTMGDMHRISHIYCPDVQLAVVGRHETRYLQKDEDLALGSDGHGNWKSFEELVDWSGMLADRPPVAHGDSGIDQYIVQPFQLLSVYPRAYIYPKFINDTVADRFIELASRQLSKSGLALRKGDKMTDQKYETWGTVPYRLLQHVLLIHLCVLQGCAYELRNFPLI